MREVRSDRGSMFYQCQLAFEDPAYRKYPSLPVLWCGGYQRREDSAKV